MFTYRLNKDKGTFANEWLSARYAFSFSDYHDPNWMGLSQLRVFNHDIVQPSSGFALHPHRDMEIVTYVFRGQIEHSDDLGHKSILKQGEVQRMTAGRGIVHSEINPSPDEELELFQIWILPNKKELQPGYEQKAFPLVEEKNQLHTLIAPNAEGALHIHQDVTIKAGIFDPSESLQLPVQPERVYYMQLASGKITMPDGVILAAGDGVIINPNSQSSIELNFTETNTNFLILDLPE